MNTYRPKRSIVVAHDPCIGAYKFRCILWFGRPCGVRRYEMFAKHLMPDSCKWRPRAEYDETFRPSQNRYPRFLGFLGNSYENCDPYGSWLRDVCRFNIVSIPEDFINLLDWRCPALCFQRLGDVPCGHCNTSLLLACA